MDGPSPARLYATLIGALLVVVGIVGFFYSASFGSPGDVENAFGVLAIDGWSNVVHILTGAIGLMVAGYAARQYSLWLGVVYLAISVWGFAIGGSSILGFFPANTGDNLLHLLIGLLGVWAALATPSGKARVAAAT